MAAQSDVRELDTDGKEHPKRRFDARDFTYIAEYVIDEWKLRERRRCDLEKCWKDIDRQIAMQPEVGYKYIIKAGTRVIDTNKAWMSEVELPLQAQALEVLTADARRMEFPDNGAWFRAHAEMTDEYLSKVDYKALIAGDEAEVPSKINQDNADKLVEGFLLHMFAQPINDEDFYTRYDKINAEAFKYGVGVGRARMWTRNLYVKAANGVRREKKRIPVLMPCSIKNLYLDDCKPSMHSAQLLEPSQIAVDHIRLANLHMAASRGSTDPDDEDGGWMPKNLKDLVEDDTHHVTLLEMEGDIVVPRKTVRSVVIPGAIVTVVLGGKDTGGNATKGVVRFRFRKTPFSSYLLHPYHYEGADETYPASPLMKGRPIQMMATDAANRLLDSSMLKNMPPVGYDRTDQYFAQTGGPSIFPGALWGSSDPAAIKAHTEIGGDPSALMAVFRQAVGMYAELTGVLPARLGAQTTSHTTAFAKDAELQRGAVRTVDYVRQTGHGPMTRWLGMAYQMGRESLSARETAAFFIGAYGGYVEVSKDQLPERATFEWFGSGGPAEEQQKRQERIQSAGLAMQLDQMAIQTGRPPTLNIKALIEETLRQGGWVDVDPFIEQSAAAPNMSAPPTPLIDQGMMAQLAPPEGLQ
jgi:hypothetical protein